MMTDYIVKALRVVKEAEAQIQNLIGEAAREGEYEALQQLARLASDVASVTIGSGPRYKPKQEEDVSQTGTAAENIGPAPDCCSRSAHRTGQSPLDSKAGNTPMRYPTFVRDDGSLLKVGKTREGTSTYEHRAERDVVLAVARRAEALVRGAGRPFKTNDLSNVQGHKDKLRIPAYKIHLCLGWLKRVGLVKPRGRKGYAVPKPDSFISDIEQAWDELPSNAE